MTVSWASCWLTGIRADGAAGTGSAGLPVIGDAKLGPPGAPGAVDGMNGAQATVNPKTITATAHLPAHHRHGRPPDTVSINTTPRRVHRPDKDNGAESRSCHQFPALGGPCRADSLACMDDDHRPPGPSWVAQPGFRTPTSWMVDVQTSP